MQDWILRRAGPDDEGRRIDRILRILYPGMPLSALHRAFRKGFVRIGGARVEPDRRIASGEVIQLSPYLDLSGDRSYDRPGSLSGDRRLPPGLLVHESRDLIFLNKPAGMLVHDGENSLEAVVRAAYAEAGKDSLAFRPGPLHRLDRNTSGIVTFSRTLRGAEVFSEAIRERRIAKIYLAVLEGALEAPERWEDELVRDREARTSSVQTPDPGGLRAVSTAFPLARSADATLACILLETGRTHQIRAQAASRGMPLEGDVKYGSRKIGKMCRLHAFLLRSCSTLFSDVPEILIAPLPGSFAEEAERRFGVKPGNLALSAETAFFP